MSISVAKRRDACLHLLRNDFDIEATVQWVIRESGKGQVLTNSASWC